MQYAEAGTNTNLASNRFVLTQLMQYAEASTNTYMGSNRFIQTQPMQYAEAGKNTNLPINRFVQPMQFSAATTSQNYISTHKDSYNCEEMDLEYRSNFARKLQQSKAIPIVQPVTNYNSERSRQTES